MWHTMWPVTWPTEANENTRVARGTLSAITVGSSNLCTGPKFRAAAPNIVADQNFSVVLDLVMGCLHVCSWSPAWRACWPSWMSCNKRKRGCCWSRANWSRNRRWHSTRCSGTTTAHHCLATYQPFRKLTLTLYMLNFSEGTWNVYLHFMSFLHIDLTQVVEILPQIRQGPTHST